MLIRWMLGSFRICNFMSKPYTFSSKHLVRIEQIGAGWDIRSKNSKSIQFLSINISLSGLLNTECNGQMRSLSKMHSICYSFHGLQ